MSVNTPAPNFGPCRCCKANEDDVREIRDATGDDHLCDGCREHGGPL